MLQSKLIKSTFQLKKFPAIVLIAVLVQSDNCNFYSSEYSTFSILITRHATDIIYVLFTALPKTKLHSCNIYEALSAFFTISLINLEAPKSAKVIFVFLDVFLYIRYLNYIICNHFYYTIQKIQHHYHYIIERRR